MSKCTSQQVNDKSMKEREEIVHTSLQEDKAVNSVHSVEMVRKTRPSSGHSQY